LRMQNIKTVGYSWNAPRLAFTVYFN